MKNSKSNKITGILYLISSVCFYICSIINFVNDGGMGVVYLCLGSTFLCLGAVWINKNKNEHDGKEDVIQDNDNK